MKEQIRLTFYLDTRQKKSKGSVYPVKLRLYQPRTTKERLFRTGFELSEAEFNQGYLKNDPAKDERKFNRKEKEALELQLLKLGAVMQKAKDILDQLKVFSFSEFERRFYNKASKLDVFTYFEEAIQKMKLEGRISTAETYSLALAKLKAFANDKRKKKLDQLEFDRITPEFLLSYESWMRNVKGHTDSTIGIYIRPLRTVFNTAISDPNSGVNSEIYPFGQKKYSPPTGQNIKKALSPYQLRTLFEIEPENDFQAKAKAFWFFSYLANGINFKDIAELRYSDLSSNRLAFVRSKTRNKTKASPTLIQAILPKFALNVVKQYGNPETKSGLIFPILEEGEEPEKTMRKVKAFTRFVNQHMKKLAKGYNEKLKQDRKEQGKEAPEEAELIPLDISTYWARHSFTTQAIRKGASMELLQESLGHKNLATTQNYFAGFTTEVKEQLSKSLLEF